MGRLFLIISIGVIIVVTGAVILDNRIMSNIKNTKSKFYTQIGNSDFYTRLPESDEVPDTMIYHSEVEATGFKEGCTYKIISNSINGINIEKLWCEGEKDE